MGDRYDLEERLLEFSVRIINIVEQLPNTRTANHVAGQLLKSGTSPYPNHGEAQSAESAKDFIHKLRISLKELRETQRWLKLIEEYPAVTPWRDRESPPLRNFAYYIRSLTPQQAAGNALAISVQRVPLIKPELLNDILEETEELIKIFVASIKTAQKKGKISRKK